jgi:hypothetical protein
MGNMWMANRTIFFQYVMFVTCEIRISCVHHMIAVYAVLKY